MTQVDVCCQNVFLTLTFTSINFVVIPFLHPCCQSNVGKTVKIIITWQNYHVKNCHSRKHDIRVEKLFVKRIHEDSTSNKLGLSWAITDAKSCLGGWWVILMPLADLSDQLKLSSEVKESGVLNHIYIEDVLNIAKLSPSSLSIGLRLLSIWKLKYWFSLTPYHYMDKNWKKWHKVALKSSNKKLHYGKIQWMRLS